MTTTDPTAIEMRTDPTRQRISGRAIHGNTPFDVPYMSEIAPNLWTGGCTSGLVLPPTIAHLVSLYPWERYVNGHQMISQTYVRLFDSADGTDWPTVEALASWVNVCRSSGPVLVHCQAGLNRSGLVAGLALVLDGMAPAAAIGLLRAKRSRAVLCNPTFERWLLDRKATP
jgi:protein-tyrosine phosphatase